MEHDLNIEKNAEILKAIRRGDWSEAKLREWFDMKEKHLEELYTKSDLRNTPDEEAIKDLLMNCLEQHYGSLDSAVKREVPVDKMVAELKAVLERYGK
jgi:Asp-tRNA(Asn)/Glu-tRNA(Gln) amidotransferase B subunit